MELSFYLSVGTSLEAAGTNMKCRKFLPGLPEKNKILNKLVHPFAIERDAEIFIVKELNPKKPILKEDSLLSEGEGLKGEKISGLSEKPISRPEVAPGSSAHKAQYLRTRCYTFAQIEREFRYLAQRKEKIQAATYSPGPSPAQYHRRWRA